MDMDPAVGRAVTTELDILDNTGYITATHSSCNEISDSTSKGFICVAVTSRRHVRYLLRRVDPAALRTVELRFNDSI